MARTSLPPGFRFHPTDIELIMYYLKRKVMGKKHHFEAISELNIYKFSPWDLPDKSCLKSKDLEWYFFCPRERKYSNGARMNRATETGYWKTTGKDRQVLYNENVVGMVKTLVFHEGNAPRGKRTDWVIHEYRMDDKTLADAGVPQDAYVLCKAFQKSGPGPKNGAQYGAPFKEEEWDDDLGIAVDSLPTHCLSPVAIALPENQNCSAVTAMVDPGSVSGLSLDEAGPSSVQPTSNMVFLDGQNYCMLSDMVYPQGTSGWSQGVSSAGASANDVPLNFPNEDITLLLEAFTEDNTLLVNSSNTYEKLGNLEQDRDNETIPHLDESDLLNGLEHLNGVNFSYTQDAGCTSNNMLLQDDMAFLELNDLDAPLNFSAECSGNDQMPTGCLYSPCNPNGSESILTGSLITDYNSNGDYGLLCYSGNFPGLQPGFQGLSQLSMLPHSPDTQVDSTNVFQTGNSYGNIISQGYNAAHDLNSTYYSQPEIWDAVGQKERGVQQRKSLARLQLVLESILVHAASVAGHLALSNSSYGGSSILVKAEVTYRFHACTKDALSFMLGESTCVYCCWWDLPGVEFKEKLADCSSLSAVVFSLGLVSTFLWILMVFLSMKLGCYSWNYISFSKMIDWFKGGTDLVFLNLFVEFLNRCYFRSNAFFFCISNFLVAI